MSVKRYDPEIGCDSVGRTFAFMKPADTGRYNQHEDYARLEAENAELRKENEELCDTNSSLKDQIGDMAYALSKLEIDNAELKATNEQLKADGKAGELDYCALMDRYDALFVQNAALLERVRELEAAFEGEPVAYLHVMPADEGGEDWSIVSSDDDPVEVFGSKYFEFCAKNGRHPEIRYLYQEPTNEG